jgi:hypothetical protein
LFFFLSVLNLDFDTVREIRPRKSKKEKAKNENIMSDSIGFLPIDAYKFEKTYPFRLFG